MTRKEKIIFLDRDGVINKYPGDRLYVTSLKKFKFITGSIEAIARLSRAGYKIFVISNQAGVEKGLYSQKTLDAITQRMMRSVEVRHGVINGVYYCIHAKEMGCGCRKPKTGLLKQATSGFKVDKNNSYFIGDSLKDVEAGKRFGVKTILVFSGREKLKNVPQWDILPDFIASDLYSAASNITKHRYERA
jgi:D-glycero-D-manno-heptose 1,7-bisphosphate phosphatase